MGPMPGTLINRRAVRSAFASSRMARSLSRDLVVRSLQLTDNRRKRVPNAERDGAIPLQNRCCQCVGSFRSLGGNNADLRQMATQRVNGFALRQLARSSRTLSTHEYGWHCHINRFYCSLLAPPLNSNSINSMA